MSGAITGRGAVRPERRPRRRRPTCRRAARAPATPLSGLSAAEVAHAGRRWSVAAQRARGRRRRSRAARRRRGRRPRARRRAARRASRLERDGVRRAEAVRAVGAVDGRAEQQQAGVDDGLAPIGRRAAGLEAGEHLALGGDDEARLAVVDGARDPARDRRRGRPRGPRRPARPGRARSARSRARSSSVAASSRPRRPRPAARQQDGVEVVADAAEPRVDVAADVDDLEVGTSRAAAGRARRGEPVPTRAPSGSASRVSPSRAHRASRASARSGVAPMTRPGCAAVGRSFSECTSSVALVGEERLAQGAGEHAGAAERRERPPVACEWSPSVVTRTSSTSWPVAAASRSATVVDWATASALPRVPMRSGRHGGHGDQARRGRA